MTKRHADCTTVRTFTDTLRKKTQCGEGSKLAFLNTKNSVTVLYRLATGWTIGGSHSFEGEIFRTRPHRPWGPRSLPGVKRPGRGVGNPPQSRAEVKERAELHLYSPSRPSLAVLGQPLSLPFIIFCLKSLMWHTLSPWERN